MRDTSLNQTPNTPAEPNWQPLNDFAERKQKDSGLKAWLAVVEGCIRAIEKTAWQGREIADQAIKACKAVGRGANAVNCLLYTSDACRRYAVCRSRWSPDH